MIHPCDQTKKLYLGKYHDSVSEFITQEPCLEGCGFGVDNILINANSTDNTVNLTPFTVSFLNETKNIYNICIEI